MCHSVTQPIGIGELVMTDEIPKNDESHVSHTVSRESLLPFLTKLNDNRNVTRIEYRRVDGGFKVTVYYAIMDLAIQRAAVSTSIYNTIEEIKGT